MLRSKPSRAFSPRSNTGGGLKSVDLFDKKGHVGDNYVKPPKKPSKRKSIPFDLLTEEQLRERSRMAAARQSKERRKDIFSAAKEPTDNQIWKLSALLDNPCRTILLDFVVWSNGLVVGIPTCLDKYGKGTFLSRIYWSRAIQMAMTGSNDVASAADLYAQSMGHTDQWDLLHQDLFVSENISSGTNIWQRDL